MGAHHARRSPVGPFSKRLARRVRALRREQGITQEQLAERADVSPQYISELERGIAAASFETAGRLAMALRVTVADLFPDNVFRAAVRQHRHDHRAGAEPEQ